VPVFLGSVVRAPEAGFQPRLLAAHGAHLHLYAGAGRDRIGDTLLHFVSCSTWR
jgi:hypothetical protein